MTSLHTQPLHNASDDSSPSFFPLDMPVHYEASGSVAARYGDPYWNLSSMSTDSTSALTINFYGGECTPLLGLASRIREQQKGLIWLHMDAGKIRAPKTLRAANFALTAWCRKAFERGVDLYTLLATPEWLAEDSLDLNLQYLDQTRALLTTLWRHREALGAPADLGLESLKEAIRKTASDQPGTKQTPLIPSRVYCAILAALVDRMDRIEREMDVLLEAYARSKVAAHAAPASPAVVKHKALTNQAPVGVEDSMKGLGWNPTVCHRLDGFISARLTQHQLALMLVVVSFTGMRKGEATILPLEDCIGEFDLVGSKHYELRGFTHKLKNGVKQPTTWVTSHQGLRAARLAKRIAHAILDAHDKVPRAGQQPLLFPSTQNPFKAISTGSFERTLGRLREELCPVIEQGDIHELDQMELARGWDRDGIEVCKRWPLAFHQLRRSLAVYAHRSGMVSLPALKAQLQHITEEMSSYYSDGFSRAVNLVFDKDHFSHEWNAAKAESSYFGFALGVLFSEESLLGQGAQRMANTIDSRSREDVLRLFQEGKLAYRETPLGGCVAVEVCETEPLEPIPYHCLQTNCVNIVVFSKRLEHVIRSQEVAVATLERDERGSVEHRLEAHQLQVLLLARERFMGGSNGCKDSGR